MTSSNSNKVSIIGAGGHTRSLINCLGDLKKNIDGIYDNSINKNNAEIIADIPLIGKIWKIPQENKVIISIGDLKRRYQLFLQFEPRLLPTNLIHPKANLQDFRIGFSNQILASVYINNDVSIGDHNIINTGAIIEHEASIANHNHISVGVIICGRVKIGSHCFIGAGTVINDYISICDNVIVGSNSTVNKSISQPGTYVGSPCKKVK